jgi:adenine phosphoribosyltransferase
MSGSAGTPTDQPDQPLDVAALRALVRDVPDFPQPGILFRDITPLLAEPAAFRAAVDALAAPYRGIGTVVAIESRGFILGAPVAYALGAGLVPVRKVGRLPAEALREEYALEYGTNTVEVHADAIRPGERVLIVDDLLATGGTVGAAARLVERLGAVVAGIAVLAELSALGGRDLLAGYGLTSLIVY